VRRGGCCNVEYQRFCPHSLTHLETSAHLLDPGAAPPTVMDLLPARLAGPCLLVDLSALDLPLLEAEHFRPALEAAGLPLAAVAVKTRASLLPTGYDFSGKGFAALSPAAAALLASFAGLLLLDLPSIDPETDGGRLLAHRAFFGLPERGAFHADPKANALVELAHFGDLPQGLYWAQAQPQPWQADAVAAALWMSPLIPL